LALKYFFDKYQTQYQDFHPTNFADIAFIPAIRPDGTEFLGKHIQVSYMFIYLGPVMFCTRPPGYACFLDWYQILILLQVFAEPGGAVLGFATVKSSIKDEALTKLKIMRHPPAAAATSALLSNPPKTEEQARKVFEYLTNLMGGERIRFYYFLLDIFQPW
jgi:hypothetical protein